MNTRRLVFILVCGSLLSACGSVVPKPFQPQTAEEQALVQTVSTFLEAARAGDQQTLQRLSLPNALFTRTEAGRTVVSQNLNMPLPSDALARLGLASANKLVNYERPGPDNASVTTFVHTSDNPYDNQSNYNKQSTYTTRTTWKLVQQDEMWKIGDLTMASWLKVEIRTGGGP